MLPLGPASQFQSYVPTGMMGGGRGRMTPSPLKSLAMPQTTPASANSAQSLADQAHQANVQANIATPAPSSGMSPGVRMAYDQYVKAAMPGAAPAPQQASLSTAISAPPVNPGPVGGGGGGGVPPSPAMLPPAPQPAMSSPPQPPPPAAPQTPPTPLPATPPDPSMNSQLSSLYQASGQFNSPQQLGFDNMISEASDRLFKNVFERGPAAKLAWQNNSGDRLSSTGESHNLGFDAKTDHYDRGPAAWGSLGSYMHHGRHRGHSKVSWMVGEPAGDAKQPSGDNVPTQSPVTVHRMPPKGGRTLLSSRLFTSVKRGNDLKTSLQAVHNVLARYGSGLINPS